MIHTHHKSARDALVPHHGPDACSNVLNPTGHVQTTATHTSLLRAVGLPLVRLTHVCEAQMLLESARVLTKNWRMRGPSEMTEEQHLHQLGLKQIILQKGSNRAIVLQEHHNDWMGVHLHRASNSELEHLQMPREAWAGSNHRTGPTSCATRAALRTTKFLGDSGLKKTPQKYM